MQQLKFKPNLRNELAVQCPIDKEAWKSAEECMARFVRGFLHDADAKAEHLGKQMIDKTTVMSTIVDPKYTFLELLLETRGEK